MIEEMENIRLFSYKMTHDTGFAPNPFHGMLTLANCKPLIRKCKKIGDWIAGFSSKELNGGGMGEERLVFLMKVTDKISYQEYWHNPIYDRKKPDLLSPHTIDKAGDNIYQPLKDNPLLSSDFQQIENKNHKEWDQMHDLSGKFVLISECFYYFGAASIVIPKDIRPNVPTGVSAHGARTHDRERAKKFIEYIQNNYEVCLVNKPHTWTEEEISLN